MFAGDASSDDCVAADASSGDCLCLQVLQLMPSVMKSIHPWHHPDRSLLCHCLHSALLTHALDAAEQKNVLSLVSSLIQVCVCVCMFGGGGGGVVCVCVREST